MKKTVNSNKIKSDKRAVANSTTELDFNPSGFITAKGKELYISCEENAKQIRLVGTNAGGWLLQEEYMCPVDFTQKEYEGGQYDAEKRLSSIIGADKTKELFDIYRNNWWQEKDFERIADMGMNVIRLPFGWRDLYNDDLSLKENSFSTLDWFIENATKYGLYTILDLHGAFGSQNGKHHSGVDSLERNCLLYTDDFYKQFNIRLWTMIAERYKDNRFVAGFCLLNEPEGSPILTNNLTCSIQWDYFDSLYRAIRKVDQNHLIIISSCWEPEHLPSPSLYGWNNICYEYHFYQWQECNSLESQRIFFENKSRLFKETDHNVPVYVGEMSYFDNFESWEFALDYLNKNSFSWTSWTYKVWCNGINNWGLYRRGDRREFLLTLDSTPDRIKEVFSLCGTETFERNDKLIDIVSKYALEANKN